MKNYTLLFVFSISCMACSQKQPAEEKATPAEQATGKFLIISDIHFNPFCYPSIVGQLQQTDHTGWQAIFESAGNSSFGMYNADTYYELLVSGLKAMQAHNPNPDMIIVNGDFICHEFEIVYGQYAKPSNKDSLRSFIRKTTSFVFLMLEQYFPNTPVLPVLGNNDDYCGDYHVQPNGPFLSFFAAQAKPMLHHMKQYDFTGTFSKGGYYKVAMPWDSSNVFIGLNTVFFSTSYANICDTTGDTTDAGWEEMAWLDNTLARCAERGEKVWLSFHIPPGMDIYSSSRAIPCGAKGMWKQAYNDSFLTLVNRYSNIIKGNFGGHTHMDEFRIISDGDDITSFVHITPSISPIFENNPAFVEISWDPQKMQLRNSVTYRFGGIQTPGDTTWAEEYNYGKTYGIDSIDGNTLAQVWTEMGTDSSVRSRYLQFYYVNNPAEIPAPWKAYWCGARFMQPAGFTKCNCN